MGEWLSLNIYRGVCRYLVSAVQQTKAILISEAVDTNEDLYCSMHGQTFTWSQQLLQTLLTTEIEVHRYAYND